MGRREFSQERRSLGAYYTSRAVADILCGWAIRTAADRVLEPSFGGCEFIESARNRIAELGAEHPISSIYGADIDPSAFAALSVRHPDSNAENFRLGDFLGITRNEIACDGVHAIVGNPPYVRHHKISEAVFVRASRLRDAKLAKLPMQANLWAFFVIHACSFLAPLGRMAWVLPQNYLYATYAKSVRQFLAQHFESVIEIEIKQHLFETEGAAEKTVLVFCDRWSAEGTNSAVLKRFYVESLAEASACLRDPYTHHQPHYDGDDPLSKIGTDCLGDICNIKIGAVLGDSRFFLFDRKRAQEVGIKPRLLRMAATKASTVTGLMFSARTIAGQFKQGQKVGVLDTAFGTDKSVLAYLETMPATTIDTNVTFKKRKIWHQPFEGDDEPDAVLTGMSHLFPRLALNPDKLPCTNALYALRFKSPQDEMLKLQLPLSMVSSLGQLSAEIEGRPYGSGLLKHEPSDARRIRVVTVKSDITTLRTAFARADSAMKDGDYERATNIADDFFIEHNSYSRKDLEAFRARLSRKRKDRIRSPGQ
ncbi:N-6 DNA methylase [Rhizobium sp. 007]|uniref:N-6 DNA methylase n=1 Tax=Rhizobium sp. 007 TaxID=2785056 RepID=UPI00188DDD69|nr:N-6 DNA methylase [Rhizobium sp. 007]QPB24446.1 N-6 DNA methylase [Rhizobium sp. 007]